MVLLLKTDTAITCTSVCVNYDNIKFMADMIRKIAATEQYSGDWKIGEHTAK